MGMSRPRNISLQHTLINHREWCWNLPGQIQGINQLHFPNQVRVRTPWNSGHGKVIGNQDRVVFTPFHHTSALPIIGCEFQRHLIGNGWQKSLSKTHGTGCRHSSILSATNGGFVLLYLDHDSQRTPQ